MSQFSSISVYDAPEVLASMALDEELTARGLRNAVLSPVLLSPREREGMTQRLKDRVGGNPVARAAVETLTNPWVLLAAATMPFGGGSVAGSALRGGGRIMQVAAKHTPFASQVGSVFQVFKHLGLMQPGAILRGGKGEAAVVTKDALNLAFSEKERLTRNFVAEYAGPVEEVLETLAKRAGVKRIDKLDWEAIRDPNAKRVVRKFTMMLEASLAGMDRRVARPVFRGGKFVELQADPVFSRNLDDVLVDLGGAKALELRDSYRRAMDKRLVLLYGKDEGAARLADTVVDADKVSRLVEGLVDNEMFKPLGGSVHPDATRAMVDSMLDDAAVDLIEKGDKAGLRDYFTKQAEGVFAKQFGEFYFPRNMSRYYNADGSAMTVADFARYRTQGVLRPKDAVRLRDQAHPSLDLDELEFMQREFGDILNRPVYDDMVSAARDIRSGRENVGGGGVSLRKMNLARAIDKYDQQTSSTYALHSRAPDPQMLDSMAEKGAKWTTRYTGGQPSVASVLAEEVPKFADEYDQRLVTDWALPFISGVTQPHQSVTHFAMLAGKRALRGVLRGPLGSWLDEAGEDGVKMRASMEAFSDAGYGGLGRSNISRDLANWMYSTHLGLSIPSMILNMSQPLLLGSTWVGVRNTAKAYPAAIGDMIRYAKLRIGEGATIISKSRRAQLVREAFPYANFEGQDLLGLGEDFLDHVDAIALARNTTKGDKLQQAMELTLKGFEKTEWLNRNVAAHAVANAYKGAGRPTTGGGFMRDVQDVIRETQFSATPMNTPMIFQDPGGFAVTGRLFSNPLMRQFLSFAMRSATGAFVVGPRLGARENGVLAAGFDFLRAMGISAAAYETTKELTGGGDISRGLFFNSLTGVFGDEAVLTDENPLPLPPVVDLSFSMARGLLTGDMDLLERQVSRMLPGGIAFMRASSGMPKLPGPLNLQTMYADWENPDPVTGQVPLYKPDGMGGHQFVRSEDPKVMALRIMGADLGKFQQPAALDNFLNNQREEMNRYVSQAAAALRGGDQKAYGRIRAEFEKRFGMPLVISQRQLTGRIQRESTSRTQDILRSIAQQFREPYEELAAPYIQNTPLTPEQARAQAIESLRATTEGLQPDRPF